MVERHLAIRGVRCDTVMGVSSTCMAQSFAGTIYPHKILWTFIHMTVY